MEKVHLIKTPNSTVDICNEALGCNGSKHLFAIGIESNDIQIELCGYFYFFSLEVSHNSKFSIDF